MGGQYGFLTSAHLTGWFAIITNHREFDAYQFACNVQLDAGGEGFAYESCNNQQDVTGAMEGAFTFVPLGVNQSEGNPLVAACPRFELVVPQYII